MRSQPHYAEAEAAAEKLNAAGGTVSGVRLDVTDASSVALAVNRLRRETGRLDVLINNAGIALDTGAPSSIPMEVLRATYDVNLFGVVALAQAVLPLMRASKAPRIVNVSSGLGSLTLRSTTGHAYSQYNALAYTSTKTALNAVTVAFSLELAPHGFKVNSVDPGHTATDLNAKTGPRSVEQAATVIVELATRPMVT